MALEAEIAVEEEAGFRPDETEASAYQLWQIQKKKRDLRKEYLDHWEKTAEVTGTGRPVDAIIAPNAPYAAPPHGLNRCVRYTIRQDFFGQTTRCFRNINYTMVWNVLDYTALTVPVTRVDPSMDVKKPAHKFLNDLDQRNYEFCKCFIIS